MSDNHTVTLQEMGVPLPVSLDEETLGQPPEDLTKPLDVEHNPVVSGDVVEKSPAWPIRLAKPIEELRYAAGLTSDENDAPELGKDFFDNAVAYVGDTRVDTGNPKDLIGDTKPDLSLVPQTFNLMVSQAMMDGARKYGPYNWRDNPVRNRVYIAAAMRHLAQYLDGEDLDPTSGVYHIGHAGACLAIIADALTVGNLIDDRPRPGQAGTLIRRFGETKSFKPE